MRGQIIRRSLLTVVVGLLAFGLWFLLHPQTAAAQSACTISWVNVSGGDWNTAGNWSPARVPQNSDNVCITAAGEYTVAATGTLPPVAGLTVGTAGAPGPQPMLAVRSPALLITGDLVNAGTIRMENLGGFNTTSLLNISGTLTNLGTLLSDPSGGNNRVVRANLVNRGSVLVNYNLSLDRLDATYTNEGQWTVSTGQTLTFSGSPTFNQNDGTLLNNGTISFNGGRFNFNGGTISGTSEMVLTNITLALDTDTPGTGTLAITGNSSLLPGTVSAGQTLRVRSTAFSVDGDLINAGTIRMENLGGFNSTSLLNISGTLTNLGTLLSDPTGGNNRTIRANLVNRGIVLVNYNLGLDRAGATYTNEGQWTVSAGQTLTFSGSPTFNQNDGTLLNNGAIAFNEGRFNLNGGTISGTSETVLTNATLALDADTPGTGTFIISGNSSLLPGMVSAGQTLKVRSPDFTVDGDLTNAGTIRMENLGGFNTTTLLNINGTLTNLGTIVSDPVSGNRRAVRANFVNRGTVTLDYPLIIAGGTFSNQGGVVTGLNSANLTIDAGATLAGTGRFATNVVNNGTVSPGGSGVVGQLRIGGNYTQGGSGKLELDVGGAEPGSGYDQLVVSGQVSLGGTLAVAQAYSYVPKVGDEFTAVSFATRSGDVNVTAPTGWKLEKSYATEKQLRLKLTEVAATASPPWLVMLYLAGDDSAPASGRANVTGLTRPIEELIARLNLPGAYNPQVRLVVLFDGNQPGDSRVYVREQDGLREIGGPGKASLWPGYPTASNEFDTGSVATLQSFVNWARKSYGARYTMLSIVDHGGGWAPELDLPGQPRGNGSVQAGGWRGMSLDMPAGGSSLSTRDTGEALAGLGRTDVLFFDACLMGMIESAYEVREVADYYIAGQNLLFARLPYDDYLAPGRVTAQTTPRALAQSIVEGYNRTIASPANFPYTIAALDLRQLRGDVPNNLAARVNTLAERLLAWVPAQPNSSDASVATLKQVYLASQKFDYDNDLVIKVEREGYVDLVNFAQRLSEATVPPTIREAALAVVHAAQEGDGRVIIAHRPLSGTFNGATWDLSGSSGLSIFLPLGERDYRPTRPNPADPNTALAERQLTYYADPTQLNFIRDVPKWAELLVRLEPTVQIIRTGPGGLPPSLVMVSAETVQQAPTVDTAPFFTPYPLAVPANEQVTRLTVYLPLILR